MTYEKAQKRQVIKSLLKSDWAQVVVISLAVGAIIGFSI